MRIIAVRLSLVFQVSQNRPAALDHSTAQHLSAHQSEAVTNPIQQWSWSRQSSSQRKSAHQSRQPDKRPFSTDVAKPSIIQVDERQR
jgi:hypothetical protein